MSNVLSQQLASFSSRIIYFHNIYHLSFFISNVLIVQYCLYEKKLEKKN